MSASLSSHLAILVSSQETTENVFRKSTMTSVNITKTDEEPGMQVCRMFTEVITVTLYDALDARARYCHTVDRPQEVLPIFIHRDWPGLSGAVA